jgi:hypothetical protein
VDRTAAISSFMPAATYGLPEFTDVSRQPPSRQQRQARALSVSAYGKGSLNKSKTTAGRWPNVAATDRQKSTLWSRSGICSWSLDAASAGALRCRSSTATSPASFSRDTNFATADR